MVLFLVFLAFTTFLFINFAVIFIVVWRLKTTSSPLWLVYSLKMVRSPLNLCALNLSLSNILMSKCTLKGVCVCLYVCKPFILGFVEKIHPSCYQLIIILISLNVSCSFVVWYLCLGSFCTKIILPRKALPTRVSGRVSLFCTFYTSKLSYTPLWFMFD